MSPSRPDATVVPTRFALFSAFLRIGVLGFGGVAAWSRHVLVVERSYLTEREFAEQFGLASSLPGANTVNMATMMGDRFGGAPGAAAALAGLMGAPLAILTVVAALYARFGQLPDVKAALYGAAAAAAGAVIGTSLKILRGLEPDLVTLLTTAAVCLAAAARAPMLAILVLAVPLSVAAKLARRRISPSRPDA